MKLFEYDEIMESLWRAGENEDGVDTETGLVFDITRLDTLIMERDKKIENMLLYAEQMMTDAEDIDEYVKRLQRRSRAKKNAAESLKDYIIQYLQEKEERCFETKRIRATVRIVKGNKTVITDEKALPGQYLRTKIEPDTTAIKAALKAGENIPGAELADSVSLTIK